MNDKIIAQIEEINGAIVKLYSDKVEIDRSKAWSISVSNARGMEVNPQGKSIQIIPLHNIKAIEFKEAVKKFIAVQTGIIDFVVTGRDNGVNRSFFMPEYNASARKMKDYIEEYLLNKPDTDTTVIQQASAADELKKFKELLDMGIITQEEFDTKKKQLLGF